tara:strand:+ start:4150 stop:5307 length:1158 start_codon:yes stop_codon:yes gene_type:complete
MGGGVDKSHGVGITSGLSGGRSGYSKGGKAVEAIMNFINPMNITKGKKVTTEVLDEDAMDMRRLAGGSGDDIMKTISEIQNPTKRMMALRALSSVGGGAGVLSSMFDEPDPSAAETPLGAGFQRLRQGLELSTAINPLLQTGNIAKNIYEATKPFGEGDFTLTPAGAIRSAMGKTGADIVEEQEDTGGGDVQDVVDEMTQEEMIRDEYFKKLELYKELLGEGEQNNNLQTIGDALVAGGSALSSGEGIGGALTAFNAPLSTEMAARRQRASDINTAAATQAMQEMFNSDQLMQAADIENITAGNYSAPGQIRKMQEAIDAGFTSTLPVDRKGEFDEELARQSTSTVFINPDPGTSGKQGFYCAVNSVGGLKFTDDLAEAQEWASS